MIVTNSHSARKVSSYRLICRLIIGMASLQQSYRNEMTVKTEMVGLISRQSSPSTDDCTLCECYLALTRFSVTLVMTEALGEETGFRWSIGISQR